MGEKGNATVNPMAALDAIPMDVLKSSPETVNAWLDTYLKTREVRELHKVAEAVDEQAAKSDAAPDSEGTSNPSA